ncbi:MAG: hypothetical protein KBS61_01700, partial [Chryseobacterium sp.]|nr:hypothetical protein [Candidatus Chryseobacterium enterohippi]
AYRGNKAIISFSLVLVFGAVMHHYFSQSFISILLPFGLAPALIVGFLVGLSKYEPDAQPIIDVKIYLRGKAII